MFILQDEAARLKLSTVKGMLAKAGVLWVVFAGAAAYCYGGKRKVTDVDILVKGADLEKAKSVLKGIEDVDVVTDLEIKTNQGTCFFLVDDEMIKRTKCKQLFGVSVPIIPVEDNVVFKAILQRGEARGKHDIEDIQHMVTNEKINLGYLKNRIHKCHAEKIVGPLLRHLGIL